MRVLPLRMIARVALTILLSFSPAALGGTSLAVPARQFEFTYEVSVPAVSAPSGPLRLWVPLPSSDAYQHISNLKILSPAAYTIHREPEYGNRFAYFHPTAEQVRGGFRVQVRFSVLRREHRVVLAAARTGSAGPAARPAELARFLESDRLVPLNGLIAKLAREQTAEITDPLQKARRIYDYVISTMRYDKSGAGWGHGDAIWACTAKRGNCTDFHSLFIGMMRAAGIPARFEIGFPLPENSTGGEIPGYHCWAEFYLKGYGWIPVDASEAWKHPVKHNYFFGAHDVNRVQFSMGRDIRLNPPQSGARLNYFVYPYAEVNGKPFHQLKSWFTFRDLGTQPAAQSAHSLPTGAESSGGPKTP